MMWIEGAKPNGRARETLGLEVNDQAGVPKPSNHKLDENFSQLKSWLTRFMRT
jgi:hypothetical protein